MKNKINKYKGMNYLALHKILLMFSEKMYSLRRVIDGKIFSIYAISEGFNDKWGGIRLTVQWSNDEDIYNCINLQPDFYPRSSTLHEYDDKKKDLIFKAIALIDRDNKSKISKKKIKIDYSNK
jgi:hypothetical protein